MLISPIHLRTLVDALDLLGHAPRRVMAEARLMPAHLDPNGPWQPVDTFDRLMNVAIDITGNPGFGLTISSSLALTRYGPHAVLVAHAPTLRHALIDLHRYAPLLVEEPEVALVETGGDDACLTVEPLGCTEAGRRCRAEWLMSLVAQLVRRAGGQDVALPRVDFAYAAPAHVGQYRAVFGPHLRFQAERSAVYFPWSLMDVRIPGYDQAMYEALRAPVEAMAAPHLQKTDAVTVLRRRILASLPRVPDITEAARGLGMSERSLRRVLSAKGLGYAELVQLCQREVAERLLCDGRVAIKQIADETGFSSPSCFHRAFRRWHGATPSEWRSQRLGG